MQPLKELRARLLRRRQEVGGAKEEILTRVGHSPALGPADLARLRYRSQDARILTFAEFLGLVAGRVPLLVEVKSEWDPPDRAFLGEIARLAAGYEGALALMSFDPAVMTVLKDLAPGVARGIVSGGYRDEHGETWWPEKISPERGRRLADLLESGPVEPHFFAYHVKSLPTPVTELQRKVMGLPLFTWTVRSPEDRAIAAQWADTPIFEGFEP